MLTPQAPSTQVLEAVEHCQCTKVTFQNDFFKKTDHFLVIKMQSNPILNFQKSNQIKQY